MRVSRQSPLSLRPGGGHCIATAEWCGGIRCAPLVRVDPAGSTSVQAARRSYRCWRPPTSGVATTVPSPAGVTRNRRIFVERQMRAGPFVVRTIERADVGGHGRSPDVAPALQAHHSRKPRRCQAMTVSGFTMTSAVRHSVQTRKRTTQNHRSALVRGSRRGRVRCSTCSWCCKASTSSWSAARERADVRRVRRHETSTDIIAQKRIHRELQHQLPQQEWTF